MIDFHKRVLELDNEIEPIRISFEWVGGTTRVLGIKVIQNRVGDMDTVVRVDVCRAVSYTHLDVYKRQPLPYAPYSPFF